MINISFNFMAKNYSFNKILRSLIEDVILYFLLIKKNHINEFNNRHLRVRILRHGMSKLADAIAAVNFKQGIMLKGKEAFCLSDGIFLNLKGTNRYLKVSDGEEGNEGKKMTDFLKLKNIQVNAMIDLGANYGEISLYFSKQNPDAKILAVEASPDNFEILKSNCAIQNFPTKNIILVNEAVNSKKDLVDITKGVSAENMIVPQGIGVNQKKYETVKVGSDTLISFMNRYGLNNLDLLKIDIEGSEPLLYESIKQKVGSIKAILLEVGDKEKHEKYLQLIRLLWENMECYDRDSEEKYESLARLETEILSSPVSDLWFIKS